MKYNYKKICARGLEFEILRSSENNYNTLEIVTHFPKELTLILSHFNSGVEV